MPWLSLLERWVPDYTLLCTGQFYEWPKVDLTESAADYQASLGAAVRGLWMRVITPDDFFWSFGAAIERGLTQAFYAGARANGIQPDELDDDERAELQKQIIINKMYMGGFANQILSMMSKDEGGDLQPHWDRLKVWVNRWNEVYELALAMTGANKKLMWVRGPTKQPCHSCVGLQWRVYRARTWYENGALPRSRLLGCKGYNCLCSLEPTDARMTPGRFPASLLK